MNRSTRHAPAHAAATAILVLLAAAWAWAEPPPTTQPVRDLAELLEPIRAQHNLPALAGTIIRGDDLVALGATGVRCMGDTTLVTPNDRFHIGSCTKAMTATLIGRLVEQGQLRWDTTVADVFPDLKGEIRPEYHAVTIEQLLTHRSGLPEDRVPGPVFMRLRTLDGPIRQQRETLVRLALGQEPAAQPGSKMIYSNMGYAVAGAMAERVTGRSWEELMRDLLFTPLKMDTAGFGPPGTPLEPDQPRGHRLVGEELLPLEPLALSDNPACLGPAGTVHCSLGDWARFAALHLRGARGESGLLKAETITTLHRPPPGFDYALGWGVVERPWAGGTALTHAGSNTYWYAVAWLAPKRDFAVLVATNCGTPEAAKACDETAGKLIEYVQKHLRQSEHGRSGPTSHRSGAGTASPTCVHPWACGVSAS
ncbi:MAG: serine hydrolase domain-containing protein [Phycisphaerae bacterium]|jgi:CubicO group peptidase (beta-lactamase class C family)